MLLTINDRQQRREALTDAFTPHTIPEYSHQLSHSLVPPFDSSGNGEGSTIPDLPMIDNMDIGDIEKEKSFQYGSEPDMLHSDVEELATTPLQLLRVIDVQLRQCSQLDETRNQSLQELKEDTLQYMGRKMRSF